MKSNKDSIVKVPSLNKNREIFKVGNQHVVIDRIVLPKFYIGDVEFTEYDMRNLQVQVCYGDISHEVANSLRITDEAGNVFNFREDGALTNNPVGYDVLSEFTLSMLRHKGKKNGWLGWTNKKFN